MESSSFTQMFSLAQRMLGSAVHGWRLRYIQAVTDALVSDSAASPKVEDIVGAIVLAASAARAVALRRLPVPTVPPVALSTPILAGLQAPNDPGLDAGLLEKLVRRTSDELKAGIGKLEDVSPLNASIAFWIEDATIGAFTPQLIDNGIQRLVLAFIFAHEPTNNIAMLVTNLFRPLLSDSPSFAWVQAPQPTPRIEADDYTAAMTLLMLNPVPYGMSFVMSVMAAHVIVGFDRALTSTHKDAIQKRYNQWFLASRDAIHSQKVTAGSIWTDPPVFDKLTRMLARDRAWIEAASMLALMGLEIDENPGRRLSRASSTMFHTAFAVLKVFGVLSAPV